jgi:hypothetical protein
LKEITTILLKEIKMKEPNDKIKVFLCSDHFERLLKDDVCSTCPSKCENKEAVKALSALYQNNNGGAVIEAVVLELKSIRRLQEGQSADLKKIEHILQGNGTVVRFKKDRAYITGKWKTRIG